MNEAETNAKILTSMHGDASKEFWEAWYDKTTFWVDYHYYVKVVEGRRAEWQHPLTYAFMLPYHNDRVVKRHLNGSYTVMHPPVLQWLKTQTSDDWNISEHVNFCGVSFKSIKDAALFKLFWA